MRCACVRRVFTMAAMVVCAVVVLWQLTGCNTVKGFGRDVEAVAQGGQDIIDGKH